MIVTVTAYAAHRSVSRKTIQNWVRAGKITKAPCGGIDVRASDLALDRSTLALDGPASVGYAAAREEHVRVKTELEKLKLRAAQGELVEATRVQAAWFEVARTTRDRILAVPEDVCLEVATMDDPAVVKAHLHDVIVRALDGLADEVEGIA